MEFYRDEYQRKYEQEMAEKRADMLELQRKYEQEMEDEYLLRAMGGNE